MNKQAILDRISKIDAAINEALQTYHNLTGQKIESLFWLQEAEKAGMIVKDIIDHNLGMTNASQ